MTSLRTNPKCIGGVAVSLFLCLTCPADLLASVDICQDPEVDSLLSVAFDSFNETTLDNDSRTLDREHV